MQGGCESGLGGFGQGGEGASHVEVSYKCLPAFESGVGVEDALEVV